MRHGLVVFVASGLAILSNIQIFSKTKINKEMCLKLIEYYDISPFNKEQFIKNIIRYYEKGVHIHLFKENS